MPALIVHGGAGAPPETEHEERQAAVERALEAGWAALGRGALASVLAAVRQLEDEPILNAGVGATLNRDGQVELDAGLMEGATLRAGAVGAVRDVRHPIDLARAVMEDGRHILLVAEGASRFARERGLEMCDPDFFVTERQRRGLAAALERPGDTVGAIARDDEGHLVAGVSTGGTRAKLPGRLGDSPLPGAGFYADDPWGAAVGTGQGEGFMRLVLCHLVVRALEDGHPIDLATGLALDRLQRRVGATGGLIVVDAEGRTFAAHSTPFMAWASRVG